MKNPPVAVVGDEPPALQPLRSSFSCERHPEDRFSGFCPSCLCERLTVDGDGDGDGVRVSEEEEMSDLEKDIMEMEVKIDSIVEKLKSVKDQIDLDSKKADRSFWSRKWEKWRGKQKKEKKSSVDDDVYVSNGVVPSVNTEYGSGARRYSVDAGRVSLEEAWERYNNIRKGVEGGGLERSKSMVVVDGKEVIHRRQLKFHRSIGDEKELADAAAAAAAAKKQPRRWWWWKVWGSSSSFKKGQETREEEEFDSNLQVPFYLFHTITRRRSECETNKK